MSTVNRRKGIVARVMERLQITDEGKIGYVYGRLESAWRRDILLIEANLKTIKINHDTKVLKIKDKIEEHEIDLIDLWESITVGTSASIKPTGFDVFKEDFTNNISYKERLIDQANEELVAANKNYKLTKEDYTNQIKTLKNYIQIVEGEEEII